MDIKWPGPYPPMPRRRPLCGGLPKDEHEARKRERPKLRVRLAGWLQRWGADLLLVWGAGCIAAGIGWIYPPAGLIAGGALLIAGGVLWAKGGGSP